MTKFLQRLQLILWAFAILMAIVFQFSHLQGELSNVPHLAAYIFNTVGVVLLIVSGYCSLSMKKHRVVRLVAVNTTILCTEALYFMMMPSELSTTMMYCFLIALLLSLVAYPMEKRVTPEPQPLQEEDAVQEEPVATDDTSTEISTPTSIEE